VSETGPDYRDDAATSVCYEEHERTTAIRVRWSADSSGVTESAAPKNVDGSQNYRHTRQPPVMDEGRSIRILR